ncbi:MAG: glycosyltransferase, partial [Phocaeicola sp.]
MLYSVIIPCYKSSQSIRQVVEMTSRELDKLNRTPYEFVLVDDASPDGGETLSELHRLANDYDYVKIVGLAKNAGQHNAVMAGLNI